MLVVNRFCSDDGDDSEDPHDSGGGIGARLEACRQVLAAQRGYRDGWLGRNVDDPALWTLVTLWRDVGSYRRALSAYDVKVGAVPVLSQAIDEPSAYELAGSESEQLNESRPRRLD